MSLLGGEGKEGDIVDIKMFRGLGASNSLGEKVRSKYSVGWLTGYHLGSGARNDYREMKPSSSSDLEAVSEVRTLGACLIVMSSFIACGQRLLYSTWDSKILLANVNLCLKSDIAEQVPSMELSV